MNPETWICWPSAPAWSPGFRGWGAAATLFSAPAARWCPCSLRVDTRAGQSGSPGRRTCRSQSHVVYFKYVGQRQWGVMMWTWAPLGEAVCSGRRNLWQLHSLRTWGRDASVVNVDEDQVICFLEDHPYCSLKHPVTGVLAYLYVCLLTAATSLKWRTWQPMRRAVGTMRKSSMLLESTGTYGCCHDSGWMEGRRWTQGEAWRIETNNICGTVMKTRQTCRKSRKLSATSVSLAKSAEKSTSRCSCRRQDSTYRDTDRRTRGLPTGRRGDNRSVWYL